MSGYDGANWAELSSGTTIGYAKIDRIDSTRAIERVKVSLEPRAPVRISAYSAL